MTSATLLSSLLMTTLLAAAGPIQAQACQPVEVHNVRPDQGRLMVVAYDAAADFNKAPATALQLRADAEVLSFQLCGLRGSAVAISLYQDLNTNGKLDTNAMGIPGEPWGASGKPSNFGPPTWDATQVALDGKPIVLKLSK